MMNRHGRVDPRFLPGILTVLVVLMVNFAPIALGSNRPLPWGYNAVLAGTLLIGTVAWQIAEMRHGTAVSVKPIVLPFCLFLIVMVWVGIQILPIGHGSLGNPIWAVAADFDGSISRSSISLGPESSMASAMRLLTYASLFVCVYFLAYDSDRAAMMLWAFVCFACLYAIYGLFRYTLQLNKILWFVSPSASLTGPFIGRNNAATYLALALVSALALVLQSVRRTERKSRQSSLRYRIIAAFQALSGKTGIILLVFIILLVALLVTASRAGITAAAGGCLALVVLLALRRRSGNLSGAARFAGVAVLAALFVVVLEMSGGTFAERLLAGELDAGGRLDVYRMTFAAIADNAWLGTGLGTFQDVFPLYRDDVLGGETWDKAHNDYLELLLGLGVPAAGLFLFVLVALFAKVLRGFFRRRRDSIYCSVAVAACAVVGLHSLADFSLQIQAVAMTFVMLLGLGVAQSESRRIN